MKIKKSRKKKIPESLKLLVNKISQLLELKNLDKSNMIRV